MTQEERYKITSNDFTDLFLTYNRNPKLLERFPGAPTLVLNSRYAIAYVPASILNDNFLKQYGNSLLPQCYGLTSEISLEDTGINKLRSFPELNLRGKGVLVGIIDTGIDYTNPIFRRADGTTKIEALWDQTIDSENQYPENMYYGTEYRKEQINQALSSANPLDIVTSYDEIGHGTMLAGIAAGSEVPESSFSGVAPDADLIIVKLKQAKTALTRFYEIPSGVPCYQENDILWGLQYIVDTVRKIGRPIAICIGLGTAQGPHNGRGPLNDIMAIYGDLPGLAITVSAGNEGNMRRHFLGSIDPAVGYSTVDLNIGDQEHGFTLSFWGTAPNSYSLDVRSPSGEYSGRITETLQASQQIRYIFDATTISIDYQILGSHSGEQLISIRFHNPSPGLWEFQVYSGGDIPGTFHMWLPMDGFITKDTFFMQSNPYTTVTSPGDSTIPITVTAYNTDTEALYQEAGRGYTRSNTIKPELAAPGVNLVVPTLDQKFTTASGTGLAAAFTAGVAAMMQEWGNLKNLYPALDSIDIKVFLIRGAKRSKQLQYPNRDWGFGIIDVYNSFNILKSSFPR